MSQTRKKLLTSLLCVTSFGMTGTAIAQEGIQRTLVAREDISLPNREALVARVDVASGIAIARHSHSGEEISYVLEGQGELLIDGEPPRSLKAGEAFIIPAGKVHTARNTGTGPFRLVGVFLLEKGKPIIIPATAK